MSLSSSLSYSYVLDKEFFFLFISKYEHFLLGQCINPIGTISLHYEAE